MSIIGTRPPLISETNFYELHHRARLEVHIHEYLPHSNREFFEKKFANSEKRC